MPLDVNAKELIKKHEGLRLQTYKDNRGILTIGYGHNLDTGGISAVAADQIFSDDFDRHESLVKDFVWYQNLNDARRAVLLDMVFNLGAEGLLKFHGMIAALQVGNYTLAAQEMLDSAWANQVGPRAQEDAEIMKSGLYQGPAQ